MNRLISFCKIAILLSLFFPGQSWALFGQSGDTTNVGTDWTNTDKNLNTTGSIQGDDITSTGKITPSNEGIIYNQGDTNAVDTTIENKLSSQLRAVSDYTSLALAISDISSDEVDLICTGTITIADGTTVTIPANVTWIPRRNCLVQGVSGGGTETLAINGPIISAPTQQWIGANLALGGSPKVSLTYPNWRTVNTTPGTTDMTTAIQLLVDWAPTKLHLLDQVYSYTTITLPQYAVIHGERIGSSELKSTYAGNTIVLAHDNELYNLTLNGSTGVAGSVGLYGAAKNRVKLNGVEIENFETGISLTGGIFWRVTNSNIHDNVNGFKVVSSGAGFNNNYIGATKFSSNSTSAIWWQYSASEISTNHIGDGCNFEDNGTGVYLLGTYNTSIDASFFEGQTDNHIYAGDSGAIFTTGLYITSSRLNEMDAGKGVSLNGSTQDVVAIGDNLKDHDWINNTNFTVFMYGCEEIGTGMVFGDNIIRHFTSSNWGENVMITKDNYLREQFGDLDRMIRFATVDTTNATATTLESIALTDEKTYWIETTIIGKSDDGSEQMVCKLGGAFKRDGGVSAQVGDTVNLLVPTAITDPANSPASADALRDDLVINTIPSIEAGAMLKSTSTMVCDMDLSGDNVRDRVTGLAGTDITWYSYTIIMEY